MLPLLPNDTRQIINGTWQKTKIVFQFVGILWHKYPEVIFREVKQYLGILYIGILFRENI